MGIRIAMIGAGNLGQAQAAHLAQLGHEVSIWNRTGTRIDEINERGGIELEGVLQGLARLHLASKDIGEVVRGRDLLIITVPASSHRAVARLLAPHVSDGMAIALHPGHTFGAIDVFNTLEQEGARKDITYAEIQTSLLTSRLSGPAKVNVSAIKNALPIAVFPSNHGFDRIEVLFEAYPSSIRAPNILKTSLENLNAPVHPAVSLCNLGLMDRGEEYLYYWEGFTPAVSKLVERVDAERVALARVLDADPITLQQFFDKAYDVQGEELWQKIQSNEAYRNMTGPQTVWNRTILEDLPTGLVPFSELGRAFGVPTPTCDALIEICNAIYQRDFRKGDDARTLEAMGLAGMSPEEILHFVETGERR